MSKRTICTCDLCGKEIEPVLPVNLGFGSYQYTGYLIYGGTSRVQQQTLAGDACNTCMRSLIEELRTRFSLEYTTNCSIGENY